ncbi:carbamoyltransferase HypF [Sulfurimonas sp. HSL-1716]|uniref:carbamoyltransferase HypF n=1 Tax=Hydrocurvibacter sulfurireducens TaxID=3131937 RepID=UPI0031F72DF9
MPLSAEPISKRARIRVKGVVQGVGFRPFVYQLALKHSLEGFVRNDAHGVLIEVQGEETSLALFIKKLSEESPVLSKVESVASGDIPLKDTSGFRIEHSDEKLSKLTMVSPDIAVCEKCKEEMSNPANRRYAYPFINCTDCGPRYSIIKELPYDRPYTSMNSFKMCEACKKEYDDPANRRYHAQPISCPDCGPRLYLLDKEANRTAEGSEAISLAAKLINEGKILALKGLGGFHLVCDASSDEAVSALRERKKRPNKPLAVMFEDIQAIRKEALIDDVQQRLILSKEHPIVIVAKHPRGTLSKYVAPDIDRVGVFLPYTPLHILLLKQLKKPMVATSANLSDAPIITDEKDIFKKLGGVIDAVLSYDREIVNGCDDSVAQTVRDKNLFMRLARGYAPKSFLLPKKSNKRILAVGANQKNTLALAFGDHIILSPHIGDLDSLDAFEYFTRTLETFKRFYDFMPDIIVCDKHPEYETSKWAKQMIKENPNIELIEVQHHYAHALACMAEYSLDEKVLAFCFDGTGYADDGTIWGGEILIADTQGYERVHHLKEFRLIGGSRAVKEPRRAALSLLFECYGLEEVLALENETVKSFTPEEIRNLHRVWQKGINSPYTSSMGRVFDAAASLLGVIQKLDYEGHSGLLLESITESVDKKKKFGYTIEDKAIDISQMIKEITRLQDAKRGAGMLISTIVNIILDIVQRYPKFPVVLCGGVFQNRVLVDNLIEVFEERKIRYYIQEKTPVNDASVSLGQLWRAGHT